MCLMTSIMHTLCMISRASPVCRRSALFAMLQKHKECGFPVIFVQKVEHFCRVVLDTVGHLIVFLDIISLSECIISVDINAALCNIDLIHSCLSITTGS